MSIYGAAYRNQKEEEYLAEQNRQKSAVDRSKTGAAAAVAGAVSGADRDLAATRDQAMGAYGQAGTRRAPSMGFTRIDQAPQGQFRSAQTDLMSALAAQAAGQGQSLAQLQLQRGGDQAISQQMALAASARGGNPALAQRQAANNAAAIGQDMAGQSAQLRLGEQRQAQELLSALAAQGRGQDIGLATSQAQLQQQTNEQNLQATLNQRALNDAQQRFYMGTATEQDLARLNAAAGVLGAQLGPKGPSTVEKIAGYGAQVAGKWLAG